MWYRHDPDCKSVIAQETMDSPIWPIRKNKQLVDSQIAVNSIPSRGRYVFPNQTVSCLYNGDIKAINAGSLDVHINLQSKKKWTEDKGKWLRTTMLTKHKNKKNKKM